jgi:uncharacterized protein (TIGR03000 family)
MSRSLPPVVALVAGLAALLLLAPALVAQDTGPAEPAYLTVKVPADAKLQIADRLTQQTGTTRRFVSPPLALTSGKKYTYTLKATFMGPDGKEVTAEEVVQVTPGKTTEVDLGKAKAADKGVAAAADEKPKGDDKPKAEEKPRRRPDVIFVPTPQEVVDEMLKMADVKKSDLVYDLGCGDGIIVVTAAKKFGCKAVGYDIDPERVKESKERAKKADVENLVTIEEKDIFTLDLKPASVVTLYLLPELNEKLVPQLNKMKEGTRVVTHDFVIPGYKAEKEKMVMVNGRDHAVYFYTIPLKKE